MEAGAVGSNFCHRLLSRQESPGRNLLPPALDEKQLQAMSCHIPNIRGGSLPRLQGTLSVLGMVGEEDLPEGCKSQQGHIPAEPREL